MRSSSSLLGGILLWIALQARNLNKNHKNNLQLESVFSVCSVDSYGGCFARNLFKFR